MVLRNANYRSNLLRLKNLMQSSFIFDKLFKYLSSYPRENIKGSSAVELINCNSIIDFYVMVYFVYEVRIEQEEVNFVIKNITILSVLSKLHNMDVIQRFIVYKILFSFSDHCCL